MFKEKGPIAEVIRVEKKRHKVFVKRAAIELKQIKKYMKRKKDKQCHSVK